MVYGLSSSEDGRIRYVGQTVGPLRRRLSHHLYKAKNERNHRGTWISSVVRRGFGLAMVVLETGAEPHVAEQRWIAKLRGEGNALVNSTDGGLGSLGFRKSDAERERIRAMHLGKPKTAEHRDKISMALLGKPKHPDHVEKSAAAQRGRVGHPISQEIRLKISVANKGRKKPWLAEANKTRVWTPEMRARISAANRAPPHTTK